MENEFRDGLACAMGGNHWKHRKCVTVESFSVFRIPSNATKEGSPRCDTTKSGMKEICYDVENEPKIQPLEGESFVHKTTTTEEEARLDIEANRLWDFRFCRTFFHVKIFNPLARVCPKNFNKAYKFHESRKKLKYDSRNIKVWKAPLAPYSLHVQVALHHQPRK